ncbi:hypothetical protein N0B31_13880 [Salinirubellus salinus]|uniref:Uncharacterized protein n=1 Tax=Salinirubellus salinus TaxID=1364945 RepID=A0A9E7R0D5_9EURY|nr:hypothetical protein [Salinirubellus salinus]UWM53227.1 hypothetical protein N0B31_13880 [Salinirubellus salinus]
MAKAFAYQVVDIVVSGLIAGFTAFSLSVALPRLSVTIAVVLASAYYFSRNPWGGDGERFNEQIDDLYERFLPL